MPMKPKEREKWEKIRGKGRLHFVLVYGALASGITAGFFFALTSMWIGGKRLTMDELLGELLIAVPIFMLGGLVWGLWIWRVNEKKFHESGEAKSEAGGGK